MVFQNIERLKREYTDQYVVVDASLPELRRFKGQTGRVKTVNMNGRALVEFDAYENIGWYDIGVDFLKIIDKPLPKEEPAKRVAKKEKAEAAPAAPPSKAPAAAGGKMSVAEMLAAARGEKGAAVAKAEAPAAAPAAAKEKPTPPAKPDAKSAQKMSVAEMLAAARGEKGAATPAAKPKAPPAPAAPVEDEVETTEVEETVVEETVVEEVEAAVEPEPAAPQAKDIPTDTPGILAYCRRTDGK